MALRDRLAALEALLPPRRCPQCRDWPAHRVEKAALPAAGDAPGAPGWTRGAPERRCPRCDWEPRTVRIEYGAWPPHGDGGRETDRRERR